MFNKIRKKIASPPQSSIEEQAQKLRTDNTVRKIEEITEGLSKVVVKAFWDSNLEISMFNPTLKNLNDKTAAWFNKVINEKKIQDVVNDPAPEPKEEKKSDGEEKKEEEKKIEGITSTEEKK